jgi:hypothetical protein
LIQDVLFGMFLAAEYKHRKPLLCREKKNINYHVLYDVLRVWRWECLFRREEKIELCCDAIESLPYNVMDVCAVLDRIRYFKRATRALWPVVIIVLSFPSTASCYNSLCNASGRSTFVGGGMVVMNY